MTLPVLLLPELDQVLESGSAPRRAEALLGIGALFRESAARLNSAQIELFGQVFDRLLDRVDRTVRIELSRVLAPIANAPAHVTRRLAMDDDIAVAEPLLEHCRVLEGPDLADIARQKSQAHLLAISARQDLGDAVTDILIRRGNGEVLLKLSRNAAARLSVQGFSALIEAARLDAQLASLLARRQDFSAELFRELLLQAGESVRERLEAEREEMPPPLRNILEEFVRRTAPQNYAAAQRRVLALHDRGLLNESKVVEFATSAQRDDAVAAIGLLCAVPVEVVDRVMCAGRLDPILIICKAAGWSWQTVRALASALPTSGSISGHALDLAYTNFERLSATTAQRVMRFWQVQHWQPSAAK